MLTGEHGVTCSDVMLWSLTCCVDQKEYLDAGADRYVLTFLLQVKRRGNKLTLIATQRLDETCTRTKSKRCLNPC